MKHGAGFTRCSRCNAFTRCPARVRGHALCEVCAGDIRTFWSKVEQPAKVPVDEDIPPT